MGLSLKFIATVSWPTSPSFIVACLKETAHIANLGWVGFDATNGICTTDAHVRVAIGLDYLGAAPVRGTRRGGDGETLKVAVHVDQARQQVQN